MTNRELPPLHWLRAFEAAGRTLSFTEAARELNITQAAVSKHVKSLELHLRHPLFHRLARSLELTKSGESYLPKIQDALDRLEIGTKEVFGRRHGEALTVRCAVSFAVNWLAPRLPDFLERHPDKQLRILSSVWSDTFDFESCDLDIQYGNGNWPGQKSHRLTQDKIMPVCSPQVAKRLRSPDDLQNERLLHVLGYQEGWGVWLNAVAAANVDPGQGLLLDTSLTAFALASQGAGVALGRTSLSKDDLASGKLVSPFAHEIDVNEGFFLIASPNPNTHPDAAVFSSWIADL